MKTFIFWVSYWQKTTQLKSAVDFFFSFSNFFFEKDFFKKVSPRKVLILIFLHYYATQPKIGPPCKKWGAFSVFFIIFFVFFSPPHTKNYFFEKSHLGGPFLSLSGFSSILVTLKKSSTLPLNSESGNYGSTCF